jgi:hypothetical protein
MMTPSSISLARAGGLRRLAAPARALASAIALATFLAGCETAPPSPSVSPGGGTAAQAHARLIDAFNSCNEAAFVGAYAPLFTFATSNTKQALTTREGLQRYLAAGCGSRPNPTAAMVQQTTRVSGAISVLAGQYRFRVPAGGAASSAPLVEVLQNFTVVLERMGDRWLVLAHHVSVAP